EIAEFITAAGIKENVNFTFHNNPPEVFSRTSVFVSLQTGTNYPSQSVLEAMACGNAVIASNRGDTGLFINNANGVLVELNTGEVAAALKKMILNREDTTLLGKQAAEFVRQYHTIEKVTEYYTGLITGVYEGGFIG
ncbi:MAG: glycosyltransferase, partial [Ignavibacteria bacterium]|nr:glycosyltransferase [Ignavibacteria bacterium]